MTAQDHLNYIYYWSRTVTFQHFHRTCRRVKNKAMKFVKDGTAAEILIQINGRTLMRIKTFKYGVRITPYIDKWEDLEREINRKINNDPKHRNFKDFKWYRTSEITEDQTNRYQKSEQMTVPN